MLTGCGCRLCVAASEERTFEVPEMFMIDPGVERVSMRHRRSTP